MKFQHMATIIAQHPTMQGHLAKVHVMKAQGHIPLAYRRMNKIHVAIHMKGAKTVTHPKIIQSIMKSLPVLKNFKGVGGLK